MTCKHVVVIVVVVVVACRPRVFCCCCSSVHARRHSIPKNEDRAVGLEKMQIEANKAGKPVFASNVGILKGPFGTAENPVRVPSAYSSRVVGCNGEPSVCRRRT